MTEHQQREMSYFDRLVAELAQEIARQERELYSQVVIHEARHPSNKFYIRKLFRKGASTGNTCGRPAVLPEKVPPVWRSNDARVA